MGIDCCDIKNVYHWEPPHTLEAYAQEAGRAGRNNEPCHATLIYNNPLGNISPDMVSYEKNSTICRRKLLFQKFLFHTHIATTSILCDLCASICECDSCISI